MDNRLLTVKEVSEMLQIPEGSIRNGLAKNSKKPFPIKPKRIGRRVRFSLEKVKEFMES